MRSPSAIRSLSLAKPALAGWVVSQQAMLRMSSSDRALTKPCITALRRLPDLNSCNCLSRYSGCCCDSLGSVTAAGVPGAPWRPWRPGRGGASPGAGPGAGLRGGGVVGREGRGAKGGATGATQDAASAAAVSKEASNFISRVLYWMCAKPGDSTMRLARIPRLGLVPDNQQGPMTSTPITPMAGAPAPEAKIAMGWMHTAKFLTTAAQLHHLPPLAVPEIAFVGRSNAGKSTCINTLTQQKQLAFASKKPGRTQHINLFALGRQGVMDAVLADLPGSGYAAVSRSDKMRWQQVMVNYLVSRPGLTGIVLLCDPRLGLTGLDEALLEVLRPRVQQGLKFLIVLTKADKLTRAEQAKALSVTRLQAGGGQVRLFSALKKQGVDEVAWLLWQWAHPAAPGADSD